MVRFLSSLATANNELMANPQGIN
ncbi:hypothetical protein YPPY03_3659, partial [Yersinia pestis PY-03]